MEKEICKTYFKFGNEIIDGYKITELNGTYYIYTYTSCESLGNWQLLLKYDNYSKILKYFKNIVKDFNEENYDLNTEWNKQTLLWYKETLKQVEELNKGFTKVFNLGKWYMIISNETKVTNRNNGETYCKFNLGSFQDKFWDCPINQVGSISEILEVLKGWLKIDKEERFSNLREINKEIIDMEKYFISILENELSISN